MKLKTILAWIGIFVIALIPVILFLTTGAKNYTYILFTLGRIAGLMGITLFALTFILSTRMKWVEDLFDGLDKLYPVHGTLGAISLILLLFHPLLLITKYIPNNIQLAAKYILPGGFLSVDFGIYALLGVIIVLVITLYSNMHYHKWKFIHEFLGVFFALAVLHILLVRNDAAVDYIFHGFNTYAIIVGIIGLGGFIYSLLRNIMFGKEYRIKKITQINTSYEILMEPINKGIRYKSGQFIFVKFHNNKVGRESHPFSIASPSDNDEIRILVKNLGDFTARLDKLREGNMATIEGPYGRFHKGAYTDEVWIAGGIGITPFLGLAKDFNDKGHIDLYYSVKSEDEFVRLEELEAVAKSHKNFRIFPWVSSKQGYLNIDEIMKNGSLKKEYYLCGPDSLKSAIRAGLIKRHISNDRIHDERFAFK